MQVSTKRVMIIISLILTILGLIYLLLDYFGYIRFIKLKYGTKSIEPFISEYSKLDSLSLINSDESVVGGSRSELIPRNKVVLSFYVTDPENDEKFVMSILDQTCKVDSVVAVLKPGVKLGEDSYLKKVATVIPIGKDMGEISKIYPVLLREPDRDTIIIALDTDKIYGKNFIQELYSNYLKITPSVLVCDGVIVTRPGDFSCLIDKFTDEPNYNSYDWLFTKLKVPVKKIDINSIDCDQCFNM